MDDQFLHRLRREPPTSFAVQLKWRLDRSSRVRPLGTRLILVLAMCGTAFALVSPPGRRVVRDWLVVDSAPSQPTPSHAPHAQIFSSSAPGMVPRVIAAPQQALPAAVPVPNSGLETTVRAPQTTASPVSDAAEAAARPMPVLAPVAIVPVMAGTVLQTPEMQAMATTILRQALFKTMGWVLAPLAQEDQRRPASLDAELVRRGATRLAMLSGMIPEVFAKDTRSFAVNTRALNRIWESPADFSAKANELTEASDALAAAAQSKDDIAEHRALLRVAQACNACHLTYRQN